MNNSNNNLVVNANLNNSKSVMDMSMNEIGNEIGSGVASAFDAVVTTSLSDIGASIASLFTRKESSEADIIKAVKDVYPQADDQQVGEVTRIMLTCDADQQSELLRRLQAQNTQS